jgi:hypothetical protein
MFKGYSLIVCLFTISISMFRNRQKNRGSIYHYKTINRFFTSAVLRPTTAMSKKEKFTSIQPKDFQVVDVCGSQILRSDPTM